MNIHLLEWALVSFILGVALSLPLAGVHYDNSNSWAKLFTNPRKLKSAHIDFFMQAFSAGLVYLLEWATKSELPPFIVIPLIFGIICNPIILLLESTSFYRSGFTAMVYRVLQSTSPVGLLFAWIAIAVYFLPLKLMIFISFLLLIGVVVIWKHRREIIMGRGSI
ncbi:hypothetical protein [Cohnella candidum]|uniref:Uncharacterized protein n=1 Tax=Cohnella candidum TaxID=2674991 RepID=A0A3G3JUY5_9BACL|nr:hypothetical protein [Cohnella candidum]AYQ71319.1 hypothetical protein EAV92_01170 [Cohnella candidum]